MKKTLVLTVDPQEPEMEKIRVAAGLIKRGSLVAFPTETVYGLGADALNSKAVEALFQAKKRPFDNPPIVHVGDVKDILRLTREVPPGIERLVKGLWPGPLTLIFSRSDVLPNVTVAGLNTIAVRMPRHSVALALIRESGCSIAAPSANLAGRPSPTSAKHVLYDLDGRIDAVIDAGPTQIGVESTVLDMTGDPPQILRPGGTPYEVLKKLLCKVELHPAAVAQKELAINEVRSPGTRYKHYAPDADVIVVEGELRAIVAKVKELAQSYVEKGYDVGVLATDETMRYYRTGVVKSLGSRSDLSVIARNLFRLLRQFDFEGVDVVIAEGVPVRGLGLAVLNRLRKASGYNIVRASSD
jgi:L-threonylcarbamoyladenylate synthase